MSDITIPPLGYSSEPPRPHRVVVAFDVLARTQAEAQHMVDEVLIEELAGPPDQLRTDGDRVFGEDFGDDVPHIRSWTPAADAAPTPPVAVPSPGWEAFEESGIPEIVAEMFPPEPGTGDFRLPDGTPDPESFEDAHERWRDECLSLAVQASRLPETLDRLERAERVRDGLVDLLERERLPVEPVKEDYLVTVAPSFEGEYEDMRFRSDHAQWRSEFTATALRREHALQGLVAKGGPRTMFLPERFHREWVPSDLIALQTLRVLVEREKAGEGTPLLDRAQREELSAMLFAADPDIRVVDPDDPAGAELYAGQASDAHEWMPPGVYDATGYDGEGQFRLIVGQVPVGDGVTASAAFPPAEHDSAVVNEIARILEQDTEQYDPATILDRINAAVLGTGRTAATPSDIHPPEQALTSLERGALLSELLAEREQHLDTDPDDPEPPSPGRGFGRSL
ncbi:hypothetical protein [Microbacterium saperdae]|uniref:Uncharacterized protein n=1 Tax=Microbacterium saperdae TaxID=69368 RepID=A0A543BL03_9MICO|nr:hypothetical protein [Microbacterium saperdae]TQL85498.1 hypothetical protein FB560_1115 [Microbacterium saperdae]